MTDPLPDFQDPLATRHSLLERVKDLSDRESWEEFFHIYAPLILTMARRFQLSEEEAEDVVQDILLKVARKLPDFTYDPAKGSFRGWLRILVRHQVIGRWRRERKHQEQRVAPEDSTHETLADPAAPDFDALWEEEWRKTLLDAAKDRVRAKAKPLQYQIFHCAVVKEWPTSRVCKDLRVSLGQVYFARKRIEKLIEGEVNYLRRILE